MSALRRGALVLMLALLPVLQSCGESSPMAPEPDPAFATTIELSAASVTLTASGKTQTLTATVKDQYGAVMTNQAVAWYTSAPAVVTVSSTGLRTAVATGVNDGTATITAAAGAVSATATVTASGVSAPVATTIVLSAATVTLTDYGPSQALTATVKDQYGVAMTNQMVAWSTSAPSVVSISSTGPRTADATGVAAGRAVITAATGSVRATSTATVTVATIKFKLAANGVTVLCSPASLGQQAVFNGVTYTKRSEADLRALVDGGYDEELPRSCTSGVTNMSKMFLYAPYFNLPIGSWDVSNVTDMDNMFYGGAFNQPIGSWDVSNVTDMDRMFAGAAAFNQDLRGWCVALITSAPSEFDALATAWVLPNSRPLWGTCPTP